MSIPENNACNARNNEPGEFFIRKKIFLKYVKKKVLYHVMMDPINLIYI